MLLFIEGYPYNTDYPVRENLKVKDILEGIVPLQNNGWVQAFEYVGYCYSKKANDVVFFLPKVVLTGESDTEGGQNTVFGASPERIIDFDSDEAQDGFTEEGCKSYKEFLSSLSIWIYRTICVYKKNNNTNILVTSEFRTESCGNKQKHNTLLDVIIALRDFNKDNQDYFTFVTKNLHSGLNKINWNKTISHTMAVVQNNQAVYTDPINKRKVVNFDEELLVIYFSILNYIRRTHGFCFDINFNYDLILPDKLKRSYIDKGMGRRRLKQIKYKYFSDKALKIWDLCYAFFDREHKIAINKYATDCLLAKKFEHVFEVMIDTLIGDQNIPEGLKSQKDGKMIDHLFVGPGLIEASKRTYYIADSKYYKRSQDDNVLLGDNSIYKQYTYAKNVIQWNIDMFLKNAGEAQPQLRDSLTEGYNPIPNFFISAKIPSMKESGNGFLSFDDSGLKSQDEIRINRQFENRLFDRDTLLLCHFDVNFLFIVSLYGLNNKSKQSRWKEIVRREFRSKIQSTLNALYEFRVINPKPGIDCKQAVKENFYLLNGKLYRPEGNTDNMILALMKKESTSNQNLIDTLKSHFDIEESPFLLYDTIIKNDS